MLQPEGSNLAIIANYVAEGKIKPVIDKAYPLAQTKEALLYVQTGRATGKVVIDVK